MKALIILGTVAVSVSMGTMVGGCGGGVDQEPVAEERAPVEPFTIHDDVTGCTVGGTFMHCCPAGRAMSGARVDHNVFSCSTITVPTVGAPFLDDNTQRNGMHSCPLNSVMVGLHAQLNKLACIAISPSFPQYEWQDFGPGLQDSFPMHVCSQQNPTQPRGLMSGIRIDMNNFNCSTPITL
jgi:hypothetical protein